MNKQHSTLKLLLIFLLCTCFEQVYAQQSRIDSIVQLLNNSKTGKGIDSAAFTNAVSLIEKTILSNEAIATLEKAGGFFIKGNDEYWSYRVRYGILNSLIATDKRRSVVYGKHQLAELEKNKSPNSKLISSRFMQQLRLPYRNSDMLNEGFQYFNENLKQYKLENDSVGLSICYYVLAGFYRTIGLLDQGIYHMKKSVSYMRPDTTIDNSIFTFTDPIGRRAWFNNIGVIAFYYLQKGDHTEALKYARIPYNEDRRNGITAASNTSNVMAQIKLLSGQLDSVMYYLDPILNNSNTNNNNVFDYIALALQIKGFYKIKTGELEEAEAALKQSWQLIEENKIQADARPGTMAPDYYLALIRIEQDRIDEAIALLEKDVVRLKSQRLYVLRDYKLLAKLHEQTGNHKKANEVLTSFISLQDSIQADRDKYGSLSFETEQEMSAKELSIAKLASQNKISSISRNFSIGIAALLLLIVAGIYYRFRSKKKANIMLEKTLSELKSTQSQLIQSEKMASLGELTAGIAHEIQNPLNFVNNFSEVSNELIQELRVKGEKLRIEDKEVNELISDISSNLEKINHHGKRAGDIVKGMLQHSRKSEGKKEPTDINALCEEYLRLAYHGLRAKDKTFNAEFKTDFDSSLPKINVVPQDVGRVILNLINNAFYAAPLPPKGGIREPDGKHVPTVWVKTKKEADKIFISVRDNGPGIPKEILDKIFQPFFTTKPAGQGTGLGLSLSYDIVKAHGGEIKVETKVGEGTEFMIQLPVVLIKEDYN